MFPAIFLDRDGTLIEDKGCISKPSQVTFYKQTFDAVKLLSKDYKLFIVTNQSWISKGDISFEEAAKVNNFIKNVITEHGVEFVTDYICTHEEAEICQCRKPSIYFAKKAEKDFNIDLSRSYAIGDHLHDVEFGHAFGGKGIYVLTGHGRHELEKLPTNVSVAENILEAANMILGER